MQRLVLISRLPTYDSCAELAATIRVIDTDAYVEIREGTKVASRWDMKCVFDFTDIGVDVEDLRKMILYLVAGIGGTALLSNAPG